MFSSKAGKPTYRAATGSYLNLSLPSSVVAEFQMIMSEYLRM